MRLSDDLRARLPELALLGLIVIVAAWLRLDELALCEFKFDEAIALDLSTPLAHGSDWPKVGLVSSVGVKNPPLLMYLLALPLLFSAQPVFVTGFVGLLSVVAIGLCYPVLRRRFGARVALGTAALWAASPWSVLYARKIWGQSLLPLFVVLLLHVLFVVVERRKTWHVLWAPILLGVLGQLHLSAIAMIPVVGIVLVARGRHIHWMALGVGLLVALGMLYPYVAQQRTHDWQDLRLAASLAKRAEGHQRPRHANPLSLTADLLGSSGFDFVTGHSDEAFTSAAPVARKAADVASTALSLIFGLGFLVTGIRLARTTRWKRAFPFAEVDPDQARCGVVWLWIAALWGFFLIVPLDIFPHYFIIAYPAPTLVAVLLLRDLGAIVPTRFARPGALAVPAFVTLVAAAFATFDVQFKRFIEANRGTDGDYGTVYVDKSRAVRFALDNDLDLAGGPRELRLLAKQWRRNLPPGPPPTGVMEVGDRHRGRVPTCPPDRQREFGAIVGCLR
jgi:hypothetical protein